MFLTLEGVEGSGKSTLAQHLAGRLEQWGKTVLHTREPGGCLLGRDIRALLLDSGRAVEPRAELYLFLADRAQHVEEIIRPALGRGEWVICDRYADSTIAYQGAGRGMNSDWLQRLNDDATGGLWLDITFRKNSVWSARCGAMRKAASGRRKGVLRRRLWPFIIA